MTPEQVAAMALRLSQDLAVAQAELTEARAERDRAREVAVALEQQVAAALELHEPVRGAFDVLYCRTCHDENGVALYPCETARALGAEAGEPA
jgi:hypothetical protein